MRPSLPLSGLQLALGADLASQSVLTPIIVNGQLVGAIGVSGAATAEQDEEIATAGARALESGHGQ